MTEHGSPTAREARTPRLVAEDLGRPRNGANDNRGADT